MNRAILVGRLTKDPELRYTTNGVAVANFTVAVNRSFKSQNGEREADFINCVAWRKQAENLANFMRKGNMIGVDGRIQTRSYEDDTGRTIYVTEVLAESIQFLESKRDAENNRGLVQQEQPTQQQKVESNLFENEAEQIDVSDNDLPF